MPTSTTLSILERAIDDDDASSHVEVAHATPTTTTAEKNEKRTRTTIPVRTTKRTKTTHTPTYDFEAELSCPTSFRNDFVRVIEGVLPTVQLVFIGHRPVDPDDAFRGVRIDMLNADHVCCCKARYAASVTVSDMAAKTTYDEAVRCAEEEGEDVPPPFGDETPREVAVTVSLSTLSKLLSAVAPQHVLRIARRKGEDDLRISSTDGSEWREFRMQTFLVADGISTAPLAEMESAYTIRILLSKFKNIVKMGKKTGLDRVAFCVERYNVEGGEQGTEYLFSLCLRGDNAATLRQAKFTFRSRTTMEDAGGENGTITAIVCDEEHMGQTHPDATHTDLLYREVFSTNYLDMFVRGMTDTKQKLCIALAPECPMIMNYAIGDTHSGVRFIMAPSVENDDDDKDDDTDKDK
jgi:hypothetical protein